MSNSAGHTFASQLLTLVIRPTLNSLSLGGTPAEMLVLGTAAHESRGFTAIKQIGGGPALSMWQIEPATVRDTINRCTVAARDKIVDLLPSGALLGIDLHNTPFRELSDLCIKQLPGNLYLGAAMCRAVYYLKPFKMPSANDPNIDEKILAKIWKQFYNTPLGAGKEQDFIDAWKRFDLGSLWE